MTVTNINAECIMNAARDVPLIAGGFQTFSAPTQLWHVAGASGTTPALLVAQYPGVITSISGFHYLPTGSSPNLQYQAYKSTAGGPLTALAGCITTANMPNTSAANFTPFIVGNNAYPFNAGDALALYVVPAAAVTSPVLMQVFLTVSYIS